MPPTRETSSPSDSGPAARSQNGKGARRNPPLVIVSERGRHSEASRRIVRAQAARASAAQSRETRARNREDKHARDGPPSSAEGTTRPHLPTRYSSSYQQQQKPQPPQQQQQKQQQQQQPPIQTRTLDQYYGPTKGQPKLDEENVLKPLVNWTTNILHFTAPFCAPGTASSAVSSRPQLTNRPSSDPQYIADSGVKMEEMQVDSGILSRRLPIALPRGFTTLQSRIPIPDGFMVLLSRTACFDYASTGVEKRLNELLFDIVVSSATAQMINGQETSEHPIQKLLRLACVCLTIFQGQRADGAMFAGNQKYNLGLQAAWDEALVLDQEVLKDQKSAEAALWAIFVISVTCGSTLQLFHRVLRALMQDLQLVQWNQVRNVLLDFIYPGSFIDAPMQQFYQKLHSGQTIDAGG